MNQYAVLLSLDSKNKDKDGDKKKEHRHEDAIVGSASIRLINNTSVFKMFLSLSLC